MTVRTSSGATGGATVAISITTAGPMPGSSSACDRSRSERRRSRDVTGVRMHLPHALWRLPRVVVHPARIAGEQPGSLATRSTVTEDRATGTWGIAQFAHG